MIIRVISLISAKVISVKKCQMNIDFNPFPGLNTPRLRLRRISATDADEILVMRSDERLMQYLDRPRAASITDALQLIEKMETSLVANEGITWGMALPVNDKLIGSIGFWRIDKKNHRAEIGYMMQYDFHGKGLMQEAMSATLSYGFDIMKLHSIEANVNPDNAASIKILERNGFVREAYFRENYCYNGEFLDTAVYSLLNKTVAS